jgi:hypothetical protein
VTAPAVTLADIRKTRMARRVIRRGTALTERAECWGAETTDGIWDFEREESPGTPWLVYHKPSVADGSLVTPVNMLSTLRECRWHVAAGEAQRDLDRLLAHGRGEHDGNRDSWCGRC